MRPERLNGVKFGTATRDTELVGENRPHYYPIKSDFDKAMEKPKFHMGSKPGARTNKNLDMPGPGEYETDVVPLHHSNLAHVIGTSVRSDLGIGKAHLAPGPGSYIIAKELGEDAAKVG